MAQTAAVDQVLGAIAEVVKDRAKEVAARSVADRLKGELCGKTITLTPARPDQSGTASSPASLGQPVGASSPSAWADVAADSKGFAEPTSAAPLTLKLGNIGCLKPRSATDPSPTCTADDLFLRFCTAAVTFDAPLTDTYLLKSLSRDTVDFLIRIAARNLSAESFRKAGLDQVGAFVHATLEQLGRSNPRPGELADTTLALAERLSAGLPTKSLETLRGSESTRRLAVVVDGIARGWIQKGCPVDAGGPAAQCPNAEAGSWIVGPTCEDAEVTRFQSRDAARAREALYDKLFQAPVKDLVDPARNRPAGLYFTGRDQPCAQAYQGDAARIRSCGLARLNANLRDALLKLRCEKIEASPEATRSALRELGYILAERDVYRAIFIDLRDDPTRKALVPQDGSDPLDAFIEEASGLDLSDLPREQLAYGFRLLGTYLAASAQAPEATAAWMKLLSRDLVGRDLTKEADYRAVLHGKALGTDEVISSPTVLRLASSVKDFLTLPSLALRQHQQVVVASSRAREALAHLLRTMADHSGSGGTDAALLSAVADFVDALGDVVTAAADEVDRADRTGRPAGAAAVATARGETMRRVSLALKQAALALQLAAQRDWVGLAVRVVDELERPAAVRRVAEVHRSLVFIRVLLSMYQAPSVNEAKAIFAASLEDASSRQRRFDDFTVDVAALFGARCGFQYSQVRGPTPDGRGWLYGLSVPVGVQLAWPHFGVLLYPVDVGTYLTAAPDATSSGPRWPDALRFGLATYFRLSASVPLVFGLGADVRPRFDDRVDTRAYAAIALELPLFIIH